MAMLIYKRRGLWEGSRGLREKASAAIERSNCECVCRNWEEASAAILREQTAIENCERDLGFSLENLLSVNS